eukprot:TRINITY_DN4438_c0_g3_i1.p1 TRINITY_DN4438_c0_g3~~TRINITY_DN4438_c0_g3_i1.p1  ORF type:complete len:369 (+),score=120.29 TRINITY_DN4438_c0_g3_i1:96-1202(+)
MAPSQRTPHLVHTFYTQRWLMVESRALGMIYWGSLAFMGVWTIVQLLMSNGYVERHRPEVSVNFWQDKAVDGNWWYQNEEVPAYCDHKYYWGSGTEWGSEKVACVDPSTKPRSTFFYQDVTTASVATSIAYGTEWESNDIRLYKDMEKVTLAFQPSYWTNYETADIHGCKAYDLDGKEVRSRVLSLYPTRNASSATWQERDEYLILSLEDILGAAGRGFDDIGGEGAMLRLQGVELVAHFDVRNYHIPFHPSSEIECTVHFKVLRDQFTLVKRFYQYDEEVAVQYGIKVRVVSTGSIGYPCLRSFFETLVVGLGGLALAQTIVDFVAQFIHPHKVAINKASVDMLTLDRDDAPTKPEKPKDPEAKKNE